MSIPVGISACVLGEKVRFDGGHKRNRFVTDELTKFFEFKPVCPEMAIGMGTPRPAIRLVERDDDIRLVSTKDIDDDFTAAMKAFAEKKLPSLSQLCGYVVCAKSPTCGMERVKLYIENGNTIPGGTVGLYTQALMQMYPWLPVEEDGRLQDPILRENFVLRVFALNDLYTSTADLSAKAIIDFHSRYKLMLMAHSQQAYRNLGRLVASIAKYELEEFFVEYRLQFMQALQLRANKKNNTCVLQHIQGYFKKYLSKEQKAELARVIMDYRVGDLPLLGVLTLVNHYLNTYPDEYLLSQVYLHPYPQELKLRYGL
ncbi:YbgA family protein [Thaumasiovibrio sp. DFM-14]|uniref:YbgA family protein n=1 Tax=Thaumasiovibrio sp. DFM-14 TaxID=3384792 RepID=UPI0039A310CF